MTHKRSADAIRGIGCAIEANGDIYPVAICSFKLFEHNV